MLQSIRDRTQGRVATFIISLVILSFALFGIHSYMVGAGNSDVVAKVNGTEITKKQLKGAYDRLRRQIQMNMGSAALSDATESDLKKRALDALVNIEVLKQASNSQNYRISSRQIDSYLEGMPGFQVNGQFSLEKFQQLLANSTFSAGEFIDLIQTTLVIDQPRLGIILSSFALPNEVKETMALVNQERDIDYMNLPRDYFLKQVIEIPAPEIQSYYTQHQNEFKTAEQVSIDYLELSMKDIAATIHPTDEMAKHFYDENLNSYTQPMQWNLQKFLIPLKDNATEQEVLTAKSKATELAIKLSSSTNEVTTLLRDYPYSINDTTKTNEWMTLTQVPVDLQKTVSTLTKSGQISDPIRVGKGIVLIKVVGIKEPEVQTFDKVMDKVKETLAKQQAEEKFVELKEKLANLTYEHPESLQTAATALGLTIKTSQQFTKDKSDNADVSKEKRIRDVAFSDDVLSSQNNSDAIPVNSDSVVVLRIKTHVPAALIPLATVQNQIIEKLKAEKADAKAEVLAKEIKQKLQSGTSPEQIAQQYHFTWTKVGYVARYAKNVDAAILYTAFRLPNRDGHASYGIVKIPTGYAIVASKGVHEGTLDSQPAVQRDMFDEQVQNSQGLLEYKLYEQGLIERAKVKSFLADTNASAD